MWPDGASPVSDIFVLSAVLLVTVTSALCETCDDNDPTSVVWEDSLTDFEISETELCNGKLETSVNGLRSRISDDNVLVSVADNDGELRNTCVLVAVDI